VTSEIEDLLPELREICTSFDRALLDQPDGGSPSLEDALWNFYSRLERIAAIIKLRLSIEQPPYLVPKASPSLDDASNHLKHALTLLDSGDYPALLKDVQEARNSLRWYLSEKTRVRTNEARTKRRRRTTTTTTRRGAAPPSSHTKLSSSSS
jgi:hypothetical protein